MALYSSKPPPSYPTRSEFDILRESHKFLRDDDDKAASWDDQLARKYYESLYREFTVCDLKHYKSGNFSLRWRTESEVLAGAGESTCGNTRCAHHASHVPPPPLTTLELPFAYQERGEQKTALVKVVLCDRCCKKLMWKRRKEKEKSGTVEQTEEAPGVDEGARRHRGTDQGTHVDAQHRRRSSRSRSPVPRNKADAARRRRRSNSRS